MRMFAKGTRRFKETQFPLISHSPFPTLTPLRHWPKGPDRVNCGPGGVSPAPDNMTALRDLFPEDWKPNLKKLMLGFDAWVDFDRVPLGSGLREAYERFSTFMDRFHVAGWRRWLVVEPLSEIGHHGPRRPRADAGARRSRRSARPPTRTG